MHPDKIDLMPWKMTESLDNFQNAQQRLDVIAKKIPEWMERKTFTWDWHLRSAKEAKAVVHALRAAQKAALPPSASAIRNMGSDGAKMLMVQLFGQPEWASFSLITQMLRCGYACGGLTMSWRVLGEAWRNQPVPAQEFIQSIDTLSAKAAAVWLNVAIVGLLHAQFEANGPKNGPGAGRAQDLCRQTVAPLLERCGIGAIRKNIVGQRWWEGLDPETLAMVEHETLEKTTSGATTQRRRARI